MLHKVIKEEKFFLSNRQEDMVNKTLEALPVGIYTRYECQDKIVEWLGPSGAINMQKDMDRLEQQYRLVDLRREYV